MANWVTRRLADVVDLKRGFDLPARSRVPGPFPVLSAGVTAGWHDEGPVKGPGFVVGRATNLGIPTWSDSDYWPLNTTLYASDFKDNDPRFLFHLFETLNLAGYDSGSVQPMLNRNYIAAVPVSIPDLRTQRAIAEVLGALDAKVAGNSSTVQSLTRLADALYETEYARCTETGAVGNVGSTLLGGTPDRTKSEYWKNGVISWIASGKANEDRVLEPTELITPEALVRSAAKLMPAKTTVLAITGATLGQVARLEINTSGNQSLVGISHEDPATNDWLYFAIRYEMDELLKHATGAAQQHVNKRAVDALQIPLPSAERMQVWGKAVRPLLDLAATVDRESLQLSRTRDELLLLLMSGRVRVKDAEKVVEDAV